MNKESSQQTMVDIHNFAIRKIFRINGASQDFSFENDYFSNFSFRGEESEDDDNGA